MEHEPKISLTEIFLITPLFIINDAIGIILIFFGLDDFYILDVIRWPLSTFYLWIKGIKGTANLVGNILEAIPYIGALPNATIAWIIIVVMDRNPIVKKVAAKVQKATPLKHVKI